MDEQTDILIVGGGIGGVVLAELLARAKKRVLVVERNTGPPPFLRPEILWPRAAQTLFGLRDRTAWESDCFRPIGGITLDRGGRLHPIVTVESLRAAGIQPFFENPNQTRETLLALCQAEVRRGVEVLDVVREDGRVRGVNARDRTTGWTTFIQAELTVGDDGPNSGVRANCDIELELRSFPVDFFVRGLPWPGAWPTDVARGMISAPDDHSGLAGAGFVPIPGGQAATVVAVTATSAGNVPALAQAWGAMLDQAVDAPPELRAANFPEEFTRIGRRWGHAPRYGVPGAVLIGDALHPVSPAGGQGANMAIADAVTLARLIISGERNLVPAYESIRRKPNERGLRPTRFAARMFGALQNPILRSLPGLLFPGILGLPGLVPKLLRTLAYGSANPDAAT